MKIFSSNSKLDKNPYGKFLINGISLAPHTKSGHNFCAFAGACVESCVLWFSGRTVQANVRNAMIRRSLEWIESPETFINNVESDLKALARKAEKSGSIPFARLNVASDIDWKVKAPSIISTANELGVKLYDYTKSYNRAVKQLDSEYPLTYSFNEKSNLMKVKAFLNSGGNVAIVTNTLYNPQSNKIGNLPEFVEILGQKFDVVDGDIHDVRRYEFDGKGKVVGLRGKGGRKIVSEGVESGFIVHHDENSQVIKLK